VAAAENRLPNGIVRNFLGRFGADFAPEWPDHRMTEQASVTTFVMGARLPWPDESPGADFAGPFDDGIIHNSGFRQHCSIRKISALGATLRCNVQNATGEELTIELPSGQRTSAIVEWSDRGETGMRFAKPIDVLALINRKLVSQPIDRRSMPRVEIRCGAYIKRGEEFVAATIRNISARGFQLEGDALPPPGTYVSLFVEGLSIPPGEIAWRKGKLAGIELFEELGWSSILPWIREILRNQAH